MQILSTLSLIPTRRSAAADTRGPAAPSRHRASPGDPVSEVERDTPLFEPHRPILRALPGASASAGLWPWGPVLAVAVLLGGLLLASAWPFV